MSELSISQRLTLENCRRNLPNMSREQLEGELLASLQRELMLQNSVKDIVEASLPKLK